MDCDGCVVCDEVGDDEVKVWSNDYSINRPYIDRRSFQTTFMHDLKTGNRVTICRFKRHSYL